LPRLAALAGPRVWHRQWRSRALTGRRVRQLRRQQCRRVQSQVRESGIDVRLHELAIVRASLEAAFMELTGDSVEYHAAVPVGAAGGV